MRRFVTLACLLLFTLPFGIAISGCGKASATIFCNGLDSGPVIGQVTSILLTPNVFGISLNAGEISPTSPTATAQDCKGSTVSTSGFTYGVRTQDVGLVDVQPTTGRLCAGIWNRNSGAGIPDFTVCTPSARTGSANLTATAGGANSNAIPVFVHPVVTSVAIGPPSTNCTTDLATSCCPFSTTGAVAAPTGNYTGNACLSQNITGQVAARVFATDPTTGAQTNITCSNTGTAAAPVYAPLVGHLVYTPQDSTVVAIDENGIATAKNPGTTLISASISNASSSAGYFSTCPPAKIQLTVPNQGSASSITVNQNTTQPIVATVTDTNGATLTGLTLAFVSTTPRTLPDAAAGSITPIFPGAGSITAICLPPNCNNAPLNEIGLFGNGKPITSNAINVTTPGTNSTLLYAGSTQSQYLTTIDFSTSIVPAPVRLPYVPNSMVLSTDGATIYLGSSTELMVFSTGASAVAREDRSVPGTVLAVSPDNSTVVITDPVRQTISLEAQAGGVTSVYGGVGTTARFSPDSSTVYVAAGDQLIVHSTYTGWTAIPNVSAHDVAVTVPSVGAFLAGTTTTARSYCSLTTVSSVNGQPITTNQNYPDAHVSAPATDLIAATNDGVHVLGVTSAATPALTDLAVNVENGSAGTGTGGIGIACPANGLTFTANPLATSIPIPGIAASAVTGIVPSTDSSIAFITYTGTGSVLPSYTPSAATAGALGSVALTGPAGAPVTGIFSSDNQTFFVGTSGDDLIHLVTKTTTGFSDAITPPISPKLVDLSGNPVVANLLQQRPRRTT